VEELERSPSSFWLSSLFGSLWIGSCSSSTFWNYTPVYISIICQGHNSI